MPSMNRVTAPCCAACPWTWKIGRNDNRIHALAGVRPDTGQSVAIPRIGRSLPRALARLDDLADDVDFVLGHNLIDFDMPHLRAANPNLRLLQLPAVDTLRLNPLAFPRNPYHYLVKHYQDGSLSEGAGSMTPSWTPAWLWRFSPTSRRPSGRRIRTCSPPGTG